MVMLYTIYKITNLVNGKVYIGKHQTENPFDSYYGSGKRIKQAISKYGMSNFSKTVMFIFDTEYEMNEAEKNIVTKEFISREDTYNCGVGGEGGPHFAGKKHSVATLDKLRSISRTHSDESKRKISESNIGRLVSASTRAKISEKASCRVKTDSERLAISESLKSRYKNGLSVHVYERTKEIREKLSNAAKMRLSTTK